MHRWVSISCLLYRSLFVYHNLSRKFHCSLHLTHCFNFVVILINQVVIFGSGKIIIRVIGFCKNRLSAHLRNSFSSRRVFLRARRCDLCKNRTGNFNRSRKIIFCISTVVLLMVFTYTSFTQLAKCWRWSASREGEESKNGKYDPEQCVNFVIYSNNFVFRVSFFQLWIFGYFLTPTGTYDTKPIVNFNYQKQNRKSW